MEGECAESAIWTRSGAFGALGGDCRQGHRRCDPLAWVISRLQPEGMEAEGGAVANSAMREVCDPRLLYKNKRRWGENLCYRNRRRGGCYLHRDVGYGGLGRMRWG